MGCNVSRVSPSSPPSNPQEPEVQPTAHVPEVPEEEDATPLDDTSNLDAELAIPEETSAQLVQTREDFEAARILQLFARAQITRQILEQPGAYLMGIKSTPSNSSSSSVRSDSIHEEIQRAIMPAQLTTGIMIPNSPVATSSPPPGVHVFPSASSPTPQNPVNNGRDYTHLLSQFAPRPMPMLHHRTTLQPVAEVDESTGMAS
eukprot:gnl/Trimastix_PCT/2707.p1 GENE.gnl/Trimastix_PCT/2707~~gnl/Trimastix_PCT/2707.p1  ORF type:complete len:203 (+),score=2.19 gnl/Trimastix_PCT/2707:68-676(+)